MKRALILGVGGQDGSYLADILLEDGYEVHGLHRHSSADNLDRVVHCRDRLTLHKGDLCDPLSVLAVLREVQPDEVYNVADIDRVEWSWSVPELGMRVGAGAVAGLLDSVARVCPKAARFGW